MDDGRRIRVALFEDIRDYSWERLSSKHGRWPCLPEHVREVLRDMYDDETLIVTNFFEDCLVLYPVAVWPGEQEWLQREGASPEMMQCFWDSGVVLGERSRPNTFNMLGLFATCS